jgi:hypothetical protein
MKRPQPDIGDILKASFINNVKTVKKLKRLWGTTTVNGVEVLKHRQFYYPDNQKSAEFEKLFKFLGAYDGVTSSDPKGVDSAWLYLNKNNNIVLPGDYSTFEESDSNQLWLDHTYFVTSNLNALWWDPADGVMPADLTLTTNIVIEAKQTSRLDPSIRTTELLDPSSTKAQLIQAVEDNYEALWDTCLISQQGVGVINKGSIVDPVTSYATPDEDDLSPNDPWLDVLSRNALRTNGIPCTVKDVNIGVGIEGSRYYSTYIVTIEIPYTLFSSSTLFVKNIASDLMGTYTSKIRTRLSYANGYWTKTSIKAMDSADLQDPTVVTRPYRLWEDEAVEVSASYDSLWYNHGGIWYLRAGPLTDPRSYGFTFKQLNDYVLQLVDSDYKKKKVKWWKKLVAVIIFVIAVIYAFPTGGKSLALAKAIVFAAFVLNVVTAVLSATGSDDWAMAFASVSKAIEPLVQVAQIFLIVSGISDIAGRAAAAEGSVGTAIKDEIMGQIENAIDDIMRNTTSLISGDLANVSMNYLNGLAKMLTLPTKLKIASINERNRDLKAEYDKLVEEEYREDNVLRGFARVYAKPATADWSIYASTYDLPYERGGGSLSIGNIQRTTKQALRKGTYNDPMFENILVV